MTDTFQKEGDDPGCPYVVLTSFTGAASANINGQTLHSLFGFKFGCTFLSMTEKQRAEKRLLFRNLRCIIIDEISMVSADMLYNLDLRLREITMVDTVFGGVSVFVLGDLYQLQPVKARYVFEPPTNKEHALAHTLRDLWKLFTVINLEENHRQGEDKIYGDLLNRVRTGDHTEEDIALLQTRVVPKSTVSEGTAISSEQETSDKSTLGPNAEDSNSQDEHPNTPSPHHYYPDDYSSLQISISAETSNLQQSFPEDPSSQDHQVPTTFFLTTSALKINILELQVLATTILRMCSHCGMSFLQNNQLFNNHQNPCHLICQERSLPTPRLSPTSRWKALKNTSRTSERGLTRCSKLPLQVELPSPTRCMRKQSSSSPGKAVRSCCSVILMRFSSIITMPSGSSTGMLTLTSHQCTTTTAQSPTSLTTSQRT